MTSDDPAFRLCGPERKTLEDIERDEARFRAKRREAWEAELGPILHGLLESRERAFRELTHSEARVRAVALDVLLHHWDAGDWDAFSGVCEKMAIEDPDVRVRCTALGGLGISFEGTDDVRIGKVLATIVRSGSEPADCRVDAYLALYSLRGLPMPLWPGLRAHPPVVLPRIPEDIDFSFVDSFLVEGRIASPAPDPMEAWRETLPEPLRSVLRLSELGEAAYECGAYEEAIEHFARLIEADPDLAGGYVMRAYAYSKLARLDDAIADFTKAIQLNPDSARAHFGRSECYRRKGLIDLAEKDHTIAVDLDSREE